jgi:phospholipase/carboxylesterase
MNSDDSIVVSRPALPAELVLLFHGVGASARDLQPLAEVIQRTLPQAMVVSVAAPFASDHGTGRQWFSVRGVTEKDRPDRIAQAMSIFQQTVRRWQEVAGVSATATTLVGFSQGAIMALESTQLGPSIAGRIVSLAGRFASGVRRATPGIAYHLIHGDRDMVVPTEHSQRGADQLRRLGVDATLDIVPSLGHGIDANAAGLVVHYLTQHSRVVP